MNILKTIKLQSPIKIQRTTQGIRIDYAPAPASTTRKLKNKLAEALETAARKVRT